MGFANPTPVTLGMAGTFLGRRYRVVGRLVMGMEEGGQTYYWNEFNLLGDDRQSATLVHEETENGPQWRMFTLFEPKNPLTVEAAAAKRVGDTVNLDERELGVTLVDESRVYHIEGQAPEGVELGDVARYFNAELGDLMIVVSWTGDEIEFYRGMDLPRGTIAAAFGLEKETTGVSIGASLRTGGVNPALPKLLGRFVFPVFMLIAFCGVLLSNRPSGCRSSPATKPKLPAAPLALGAQGRLRSATWHIRGHAVTEMAQVGQLYDRHEYSLVDDAGNKALLVFGAKPGAKDWILFTPFQPTAPLTPAQAGAKRVGDKFDLDGASATITELHLATLRQTENEDQPELANGTAFYGFTAQSGAGLILARWNATNVLLYRGAPLPAKEVTAAFSSKPTR